ncbi:hypothetical protein CGGC5_v003620 [Colletotrichum fructicola Nara gc5]|uniref:Uncharacterized protein n=1 Tax=Colletotrichum fructicola (strain Nara gc5) TaxID=1213859 RepID=A0A7J6JIH5_COLFN|nr:hypothetical protein CGGC5_v003620 [Colletotrichum fructicola Nara gc5]
MREARRRSRLGKSPGATPATSRRYITVRASSNDRYIDASRRPPGSSRRCFEGSNSAWSIQWMDQPEAVDAHVPDRNAGSLQDDDGLRA